MWQYHAIGFAIRAAGKSDRSRTPRLADPRRSEFSHIRAAPKLVMSNAAPNRCRFEP